MSNPKNLDFDKLLSRIIDTLDLDMDKVEQIYVYGSFVKEESNINEDSDIDVIVVVEEGHDIEYDGLNPKKILVECEDGSDYGEREIDLTDAYPSYDGPIDEDTPLLS